MKKVLIASAIFLIAATSGCHKRSDESPFQSVKSGKSIRALSQFELVDDFNEGINKSRRGSGWIAESSAAATLKLASQKENSAKHYGSVLQVSYGFSGGGQGKVFTNLFSLDISKAVGVAGRIGSESWDKYEGRLFLSLQDSTNKSAQAEILKYLHVPKDGWTDFSIPKTAFNGLDFNKLEKLEFIIRNSGEKQISGALTFDDIVFYGPEELYFESQRDNLKNFPESAKNVKAGQILELDDKNLLKEIAISTWQFFENSIDKNSSLIVDHIRLGRVNGIGSYTSTSNIAFYWLACVSARDLGFISEEVAVKLIDESLKSVEKLERWRGGYFYNFYNTETLKVTRKYVSSVDNGWLVAALAVVRQAIPGKFDKRIETILKPLNFAVFEDSVNGQLHIGFDEEKDEFSPHHYGLLVSEARLTSYLAIGKGDLPKTHWAKIYRTPPKTWDWQNQAPEGRAKYLFGLPVFEGYYTYHGNKIVPSWGGSLFEFLSPALIIKEQELGQNALGKNNIVATQAHISYALKEKGYALWGIAPAGIANGKDWSYKELGIKEIAVKGYPDLQIIAPYASILALEIAPEAVIKNIREMIRLYPDVYGPYGLYDAIEIDRKRVNYQYLTIDQGMILIALTNYLNNGSIRNWFHKDPIGKGAEPVLIQETFFE